MQHCPLPLPNDHHQDTWQQLYTPQLTASSSSHQYFTMPCAAARPSKFTPSSLTHSHSIVPLFLLVYINLSTPLTNPRPFLVYFYSEPFSESYTIVTITCCNPECRRLHWLIPSQMAECLRYASSPANDTTGSSHSSETATCRKLQRPVP